MPIFPKGFTLIELMIVIAIISILASIAVPQYQAYTIRTQISEGLNMASETKTAIGHFYSSRGRLPDSNASVGLFQASSITGNYVTSIEVTDSGAILITFGNRVNALVSGNTLGLNTGRNAAGNLVWICGNAPLPSGVTQTGGSVTTSLDSRYLPTNCRN